MAKKQKSKRAGRARKDTKTATTRAAKAPRTKERDPRLPAAGTTLTRTYKGKDHRVTALDAGFRYDGREYRSLTAIAREVTGYPAISGPAWFGIAERKAAVAEQPAAPVKARAPKAKRAKREPQPTPAAATAPAVETEVARAE